MSSGVTDFLLARIAEDEAAARADGPRQPHARYCGWCLQEGAGFDEDGCECGIPVRVLRECAAKRQIVEFHRPMQLSAEQVSAGFLPNCEGCWEEGGEDGGPTFPCRTLRWLAEIYADHPDWQR